MNKALGIALATFAATCFVTSGTALASTPNCSLVAGPAGSDSASGTVAAPFRTAQKLVDSLAPGQVGCLEGGTYREDVTVNAGGNAGAPVTLTSYPGQSAEIVGRFWIPQQSSYVTVTGLTLDGVNSGNLPSPTVNSDHATFSHDNVTDDHTAICFVLGSAWGRATNTVITDSRIHDCGVMPANNHEHGIYVDDATNTTIDWNEIYNNADRGIQLYPDAMNTTIDHNAIVNNGEGIIFSGDDGTASDNANVYDNIISGAKIRYDVESWYPSGNPVGSGNTLHNNCIWGGAEGTVDTSGGGFTANHNTTANPQFVNASSGDFRTSSASPCSALAGNIGATVQGVSGVPSGGHTALGRIAITPRKKAKRTHSHARRTTHPARRHAKRHARRHHSS